MHKRKLGWLDVLFILIGLAIVVYFSIRDWKQSNHSAELFRRSEAQAEILEPLVKSFYQAAGRVPWSLVDHQPNGQSFAEQLPNGECFANSFTGRRTEPRFFDRIYKEADRGTVAIVYDGIRAYIVVYGDEKRTSVRRLRL